MDCSLLRQLLEQRNYDINERANPRAYKHTMPYVLYGSRSYVLLIIVFINFVLSNSDPTIYFPFTFSTLQHILSFCPVLCVCQLLASASCLHSAMHTKKLKLL